MTLIEVMVATVIVMTVVASASDGIVAVKAANARADRRQAADATAADEIEKLSSLPFAPVPSSSGTSASNVAASVFPNAEPSQSASPSSGFFSDPHDGCPAGSFFATSPEPTGQMTVAATFVAGTADGWQAVPVALLAGYDLRRSVVLPSEALLVRVTVAWSSGRLAGNVSRWVVIASPAQGPCTIAAPSGPQAV